MIDGIILNINIIIVCMYTGWPIYRCVYSRPLNEIYTDNGVLVKR